MLAAMILGALAASRSPDAAMAMMMGGQALAVLVDRGGRQLPFEPALSAARITLPSQERVALGRADDGRFQFHFERV